MYVHNSHVLQGHHTNQHIPTARGFNFSLGFYGGFQHPKSYKYEWIEFGNNNSNIPVSL